MDTSSFPPQGSGLLPPALFAVYFFSLVSRCPALCPEGGVEWAGRGAGYREAGQGSQSSLFCSHKKGLREAGSTTVHLRWSWEEVALAAPTTTTGTSRTHSGLARPSLPPTLAASFPWSLGFPSETRCFPLASLSVVVRAADDQGRSKANHGCVRIVGVQGSWACKDHGCVRIMHQKPVKGQGGIYQRHHDCQGHPNS